MNAEMVRLAQAAIRSGMSKEQYAKDWQAQVNEAVNENKLHPVAGQLALELSKLITNLPTPPSMQHKPGAATGYMAVMHDRIADICSGVTVYLNDGQVEDNDEEEG